MKPTIKRKEDLKMQKQIRAAIYCRVATPDQLSLNEQEKRVGDYAKAKGYVISSITSESFKGTTFKRLGIEKVLTDAKNGLMNILLMTDVSRIGRKMIETMRFVRELRDYGVEVECVNGRASPECTKQVSEHGG